MNQKNRKGCILAHQSGVKKRFLNGKLLTPGFCCIEGIVGSNYIEMHEYDPALVQNMFLEHSVLTGLEYNFIQSDLQIYLSEHMIYCTVKHCVLPKTEHQLIVNATQLDDIM